jgi:hypothetical protein
LRNEESLLGYLRLQGEAAGAGGSGHRSSLGVAGDGFDPGGSGAFTIVFEAGCTSWRRWRIPYVESVCGTLQNRVRYWFEAVFGPGRVPNVSHTCPDVSL